VNAENDGNLTNMLKKMNDTLQEHHMKINQRTTKVLICNKQQIYANILLKGQMLETVQNFIYLLSKITSDGNRNTGIISRIAQAKEVSYKKKNFFTTNTVSLDKKKKHL